METGTAYKIEFDARSDVAGRKLRMFFGEDGGGFASVHVEDVELTTEMQTFEILFNLHQKYSSMKLGFEMGHTNDNVFIDNVSLMQTDEVVAEAPPAPDGFIASDMVGENPVGDGEIFVAAGPNNTAEENIAYRLFYAITSEAPGNPQDATEYQFGSNPDDGQGVNPFGFVIDGLEHGTEYTLWLYQYHSAFELFSDPAVASAVSGGTSTSIDDEMTNFPKEYNLSQNYPNPFNPTTQIQYSLPASAYVTLSGYDMTGRQVATLVNESVGAGSHTVTFDAGHLSSGLYLYRLQADSNLITRKMMLVK